MRKLSLALLVLALLNGCATHNSLDRVPEWLKVPGYNSPELLEAECVSPTEYNPETGKSLSKYTGRCISVTLYNQPIQLVVHWLGEVANLNHVFDNDIQCTVNAHFVSLPWDAILDYTLRSCGLRARQDGNTIRILTSKNYDEQFQGCTYPVADSEDFEPLGTKVIQLQHVRAEEMLPVVADLLSKRGKSYIEKGTNSIIVRDIKRGEKDVEAVMKILDVLRPGAENGQITNASTGGATHEPR